jgi:type II secretory pathway component PulC
MTKGFLPAADAALLAWANHFATMIAAGPPTIYGLTTVQSTAFTATVASFQTALTACEPTVRNKAATAAKNSAKASLKLSAKQLASIIDGQPNVSDAQKIRQSWISLW